MGTTRTAYRGYYWWTEPGAICPILKISTLPDGHDSQYSFRSPSQDDHERKARAWVDARLAESSDGVQP